MNNDNRNLILALVLMTAVWFGFSFLFPAKAPQLPAEPVATGVSTSGEAAVTGTAALGSASFPAAPLAPTVVAPSREVVIDTDLYRAVFTTAGARLISLELKQYRATSAADAGPVQLVKAPESRYATLRTTGSEALAIAGDAPYTVDAASATLQIPAGQSQRLTFRHVTATGLEVLKTFTFSGDQYGIDGSFALRNSGAAALRGTLELSLIQQWDETKKDSYSFAGPAALVGDKLHQVDVDDLEKSAATYEERIVWSSLQSKYFMTAAVPLGAEQTRLRLSLSGDLLESTFTVPALVLQPSEQRRFDYLLFCGPKDHALLKAADHRLDEAVHFGWFDLLAKPLLHVLNFFYGFLKNYGLAIILLTVIIKLLFWPLTHKSYASMKAMQKLQPEMQKLRDKFKNDKERLNRELMELYKTHRVNPLGGCLPMLVQIPVFFALYKVLLDSIALRQAPFMLWLTDLSAKDPYYITPLLMGASMFVQQKMTPTTADPMQAKIFMFMPVIFTFLFLNFPSGLVIYWLVNNLLTIAQQFYINRRTS
jgi:YidC/Oxa1 family membrane protein insertase